MDLIIKIQKDISLDISKRRRDSTLRNRDDDDDSWMTGIKSFNFKYTGDLFGQRGEYSDSVIYMSRMAPKERRKSSTVRRSSVVAKNYSVSSEEADRLPSHKQIKRKRQCAASLESVAANELLQESLLRDGAVTTLVSLLRTKDAATIDAAVSALCYFSGEASGLGRETLIRNGCITVLQNVLNNYSRPRIVHNCLATLANLTIESGFESTIVRERAINTLIKYQSLSKLSEYFCIMSVYNLTCQNYSFARIEDVVEAIATAARICGPKYDELFSKALFNLASNKVNQKKLLETNCLSLFVSLGKSDNPVARSNILKALCHVADYTSSRKALFENGIVESLVDSLETLEDEKDMFYLLSTLSYMSSNPEVCKLLSRRGFFETFPLLSSRITDPSVRDILICTLANLIRHPLSRDHIGNEIVHMVLKASPESAAGRSVLFCTAALTSGCIFDNADENLMDVPFVNDIADLWYLEDLFRHTEMVCEKDSVEYHLQMLILYNMCFLHDKLELRDRTFPRAKSCLHECTLPESRRLACLTLAQLCLEPRNHSWMMDNGLLPLLAHAIQSSNEASITAVCLEIVCCLFDAKVLKSYTKIVSTIFPILIQTCNSVDGAVRSRTAACCARFSTVNESRKYMVQNGLIASLALLAGDDDPQTLLLCVSTYSHLSCDPDICKELIHKRIVKSLSSLSAAPEEDVRRACAIAFCNLSYAIEHTPTLVQQESLPALLVISCVKSDNVETRSLAMKAVMNLMRVDDNLAQLVKEGISWAFAVFAESITPADEYLLSVAFCRLCHNFATRDSFIKQSVLTPFFKLLTYTSEQSDRLDIKNMILRGIINLLEPDYCAISSTKLLRAGILSNLNEVVLASMFLDNSEEILTHCTEIIGVLYQSCFQSHHSLFFSTGIFSSLAKMLQYPHLPESVRYNCSVILHLCSLDVRNLGDLMGHSVIGESIVNSINDECPLKALRLLLRLLYNLTCDSVHLRMACQFGIVDAVSYIINSLGNDVEALRMSAAIMRNLSCDTNCHEILAEENAIVLMEKMFHSKDRSCKEDSAVAICYILLGNVNSTHMLDQGALHPVLWLILHPNQDYVSISTAVIRKLATPIGNLERLIEGETIQKVTALLDGTASMYIKENCIATMYRLSLRESGRSLVASYGVIGHVLDLLRANEIENLRSSFQQMCLDLLENLAPYLRPDSPAEATLNSTLVRLLQSLDKSNYDGEWKNDRSFCVFGSDLEIPTIFEGRKLTFGTSPQISTCKYLTEYDGFQASFSFQTGSLTPQSQTPIAPDPKLLHQKQDVSVATALRKNIQSSLSTKSTRWKKLATLEISSTKLYPKIVKPNLPMAKTEDDISSLSPRLHEDSSV